MRLCYHLNIIFLYYNDSVELYNMLIWIIMLSHVPLEVMDIHGYLHLLVTLINVWHFNIHMCHFRTIYLHKPITRYLPISHLPSILPVNIKSSMSSNLIISTVSSDLKYYCPINSHFSLKRLCYSCIQHMESSVYRNIFPSYLIYSIYERKMCSIHFSIGRYIWLKVLALVPASVRVFLFINILIIL